MNHQTCGRGRGGVAEALRACGKGHGRGIASDRLYSLEQQIESRGLLRGDESVHVIQSEFGHDGFLLETMPVGDVVRGHFDMSVNSLSLMNYLRDPRPNSNDRSRRHRSRQRLEYS